MLLDELEARFLATGDDRASCLVFRYFRRRAAQTVEVNLGKQELPGRVRKLLRE